MAIFEIPEKFAGKTLRDIQRETGGAFRPDILGGFIGIDQNTPLTAGQSINLPDDPGSGEVKFASQFFSPAGTAQAGQRQAFNLKLRGEEESFLGRFRQDFPQVLTGIEEQLGLPGLRQEAFTSAGELRDIPQVQKQATAGFDVTANQLARIISAEREKKAPIAQEAVRQAQFGEEEFGRRAQRELVPFETEISFMKDRFAREASGFDADADRQLNLLLQQIQQEGATNIATIQQATQLAQLEESKRQFEEGISTIDLGNRVALLDIDGNEIGSFDKKKLGGDTGTPLGTPPPPPLQTLQPTSGFIPTA